jgi:hemolysin III
LTPIRNGPHKKQMRQQTKIEERLNSITHALGAISGIIGLIALLLNNTNTSEYSTVSLIVYGFSIIILFTASTLYHFVENERLKHRFRILDHVSIYLLIAGTYTPVLVISLMHSHGFLLLLLVWTIALLGTIMKLFFTGKFEKLSTLLYLAMGWLIVFDFAALKSVMDYNGILLLFAGGFFYTVGIIFYAVEKLPYNHVIWHFFVLAGAISHFFMIYLFVI